MGQRRFAALLRGLSGDSVWRHVLATTPQVASSEEAAAILKNM